MADRITVKLNGESQFQPHPEGQFAAVCVDVIDLGVRWEQFPGSPGKESHKVALVFATGERNVEGGTLHDIGQEFTASVHEKAKLRQFLEAWRGKKYEDKALRETGLPLDKLAGQGAYVSIVHEQSKAGRTYARIGSIMPLPKGVAKPDVTGWERPKFWGERKAAYAAELVAHRKEQAPTQDYDDMPDALEGADDDLPF